MPRCPEGPRRVPFSFFFCGAAARAAGGPAGISFPLFLRRNRFPGGLRTVPANFLRQGRARRGTVSPLQVPARFIGREHTRRTGTDPPPAGHANGACPPGMGADMLSSAARGFRHVREREPHGLLCVYQTCTPRVKQGIWPGTGDFPGQNTSQKVRKRTLSEHERKGPFCLCARIIGRGFITSAVRNGFNSFG